MKRLAPKHPLAVRWFHWINFPLLGLMIWSGMLIYWASPVYRLGWGKHTLLAMKLSPHVNQLLHINNRLAQGMAWHFFLMWLFGLNGLLYVGYTLLSGEWRELVPNRRSFREAWQTVLHDLHLSKVPPPPAKFNGAQRFAYTGVVLMGLGSLLTGLAIYKPIQVSWLTALLGGYAQARFFHFWLTMGYLAFFVVHISQVMRAGWNNFRAMVIGVEVVDEPAPVAKESA
ncbi:MAG TPA: cytochrome b/b6 domain-containing protein, partial [Thermoanaerobaculia bacterium]|jgi:thiosulfate reductase cytochrome b subunit|nr:cytochrome b/b6 domain-containing protein [Thermoanaerobaculia bacterium]